MTQLLTLYSSMTRPSTLSLVSYSLYAHLQNTFPLFCLPTMHTSPVKLHTHSQLLNPALWTYNHHLTLQLSYSYCFWFKAIVPHCTRAQLHFNQTSINTLLTTFAVQQAAALPTALTNTFVVFYYIHPANVSSYTLIKLTTPIPTYQHLTSLHTMDPH